MITAKEEVRRLLDTLPDDASLEDIQYHLYVLEKVKHGIERADSEGAVLHDAAKARLEKWLSA